VCLCVSLSVCTYVASNRDVKAVILVSPLDSLLEMAKRHYPYLPSRLFLRHSFDALSMAPKIKAPVLCLIGSNDKIVPNKHSLNLLNRWKGPQKILSIKNADHNNITEFPEYWQAIQAFLSSL